MTQPRLDWNADVFLIPRDSHVTEPTEVERLAGQNAEIVRRLMKGPATNRELARISLKYTSRISDARRAGYVITAKRHPKGLTIYSLGG